MENGPFEVSISHFRIVTFLLSCGEITKKIWVKLCSKDSFTHSSRVTIVRNCFTFGFNFPKIVSSKSFKTLNSCEQCVIFREKGGRRGAKSIVMLISPPSFNSTKKRFAFHFSHRYSGKICENHSIDCKDIFCQLYCNWSVSELLNEP